MATRAHRWIDEELANGSGTRSDLVFSLDEEAYVTGTGGNPFSIRNFWADIGIERSLWDQPRPAQPSARRKYSAPVAEARKSKRKRQRKARRTNRRT